MAEKASSKDGKELRDLLTNNHINNPPVLNYVPKLIICDVKEWNFPRKIFNFLTSLSIYGFHNLPINELEFVRMARTILLKRVMDVKRMTTCYDCPSYDGLQGVYLFTKVPAPIYDLLYSLGNFMSTTTGYYSVLDVPSPADPPEDFWSIDKDILKKWDSTMDVLQNTYELCYFPDKMDYEDRPMMQSVYKSHDGLVQIKSYTTETKSEHILVRFVNGDILKGHNPEDFNIINCCPLPAETFDHGYIASFAKRVAKRD